MICNIALQQTSCDMIGWALTFVLVQLLILTMYCVELGLNCTLGLVSYRGMSIGNSLKQIMNAVWMI